MKIRKKACQQRRCTDCSVRIPDDKSSVWYYGSEWRGELCNNCDELRIFITRMNREAQAFENAWFTKFYELFPEHDKSEARRRPMTVIEFNQRPRTFVDTAYGSLDNILSPSPNRHMLNKGLGQLRRNMGGERSGRDTDKL